MDCETINYTFFPNKIEEVHPDGNIRSNTKIPKARSGHRIVMDSGNVYSFGGYNPYNDEVEEEDQINDDFAWPQPFPLFRELWKFNIASKTWNKLKTQGNMPDELASHSAILVHKQLLVFGGTGVPFGQSSSNKLHICNLETLQWHEVITKKDLPLEQYGQAMTIHGNYLYVIGGTTGFEYSIDIHRLDLQTLEWEKLQTNIRGRPEERYRHEVAVYGGKIYIFGGGTATESFGFKMVSAFNLDTHTWQLLKTYPDLSIKEGYPAERRCHGCVKHNSDVYICGGHDGSTIFPDIWRLNMQSLQWKKLKEELPHPVYFHSTALSDSGQLYIFGGVTSIEENERTNKLHSMWLDVPPLLELCWNSVLFYMPQIERQSREKLVLAGVPKVLLNRVDFVSEQSKDC